MKKFICFVLTLLIFPAVVLFSGCSLSMNLIIDTEYAKTEYVIGETFSSDGLIVKAQSSNGEVEVDDYKVDYSAFDNSEVGTYLIKVTYEDRTATYSVKCVKIIWRLGL